MNTNYSYTATPAEKITVTISRQQLWKNFIESWRDLAWDDYNGTSDVKDVADVLLNGEPLDKNFLAIRRLFRDGWTVMLLGNAMSVLDNGRDIIREIVVTDGEDESVIIRHEDIVF
jgi:hypothetical protein